MTSYLCKRSTRDLKASVDKDFVAWAYHTHRDYANFFHQGLENITDLILVPAILCPVVSVTAGH
jgi:hypothetical protein